MFTIRLGAAAFAAAVAALSSVAVLQNAQPASAHADGHARWILADRDDHRRFDRDDHRRFGDRDRDDRRRHDRRFFGNNGLHNGFNNPNNPHFRRDVGHRDRDHDHDRR